MADLEPCTIQKDFDRIALLSTETWSHNNHYHAFLLEHLPVRRDYALDIGCGTGAFARLLATRFHRVLALDLSPQMIRVASEQSREYPNIDFRVADVTTWEFPVEQFDCIATIATLHHLPLADMLAKMRMALRANGMLVALDLYKAASLSEFLSSAVAMPANLGLQLLKTGRLRPPRSTRKAWAEHGRHDSYPGLVKVRQACQDTLPGARVKRHLLWRYSIVWEKER